MGLCFQDNVPFGEVAMAPPSLSIKPRKAQVKPHVSSCALTTLLLCQLDDCRVFNHLSRVVQKDSKKLLLSSLLGHTVTFTNKPSMARQRMMEEERERVVQAYRHLKKQRQEQHEARTAGVEKLKNLQWCFMSETHINQQCVQKPDKPGKSVFYVPLELIPERKYRTSCQGNRHMHPQAKMWGK